jgi:hypothetical protein
MATQIRTLHRALRLCVDLEEKVLELAAIVREAEKSLPDDLRFPLLDAYCDTVPSFSDIKRLREVLGDVVELQATQAYGRKPFAG